MSWIRRSSTVLIGALPILLGVLLSSPGQGAPATPHASAAITRAATFQTQPLTDHTWRVTRHVALGASDQAVANVSPVVAPATFASNLRGSDSVAVVAQPATFIHHMTIGSDSASDGRPLRLITC